MTQYLLGMYQPTGGTLPPDELAVVMRDVLALRKEMQDAGAWVFAGGLHDPDASTVVRVQGDEALVTDGPFAESKEHLGGFTVVEAPDLDAALEWARRSARATGLPVEVRPFRDEE